MNPTNIHRTLESQKTWLNASRPITAGDLAGRIILLDFWTFCCINCMHVIPDLKYLEEKFGHDLTVIGVHSAKFKNERDTENIRSAILRYGIEHPVVNDFDFSIWQKFGIRAWPTFVLINPKGIIEATYSGEGNRDEAERDIAALIEKYKGKFVGSPLPLALEKDKMPASLLSFPGKLDYTPDFGGKPALFVSDTAHHRILVIDPHSGTITLTIGSGSEGLTDGDFATAQFRRPQGVLYDAVGRDLFVADTENHVLRVIDFENNVTRTLAGTGRQGHERKAQNAPAPSTPLASPWDLAFYPDSKHIVIAMAGMHQLWSYDIAAKTVSVIAGNGQESIDDGGYPENSLSQPSGLSAFGGRLYFVDSETSSLRVLENGEVKTLIGTGLFDFGYKEGRQPEAKMQHALGVYADETGVYIADSYNHSIRRYDPNTGLLSNFAGHGERGNVDGTRDKAEFNEPNDLVKVGDKIFVADTNNHALRIIEGPGVSLMRLTDQSSGNVEFSDSLPSLETTAPFAVAAHSPITVDLGLKAGWKINAEAPSYLALFEMGRDQPRLQQSYGLAQVKTKSVTLPALAAGRIYRLQGTLYYCEEKEGAQCLIKSFDATLTPAGDKKAITLKLN